MKLNSKHAIGFLVALLCIFTIGVAWHIFSPHPTAKTVLVALTWFSVLGGAVTISYLTPTAVAPTPLQVLPLSKVVALVAWADADLLATITHNFNIPLASTPTVHGQNSANPWVTIALAAGSAGTVYPVLNFTRGTNTIVITKPSVVGSNSTFEVTVERHEILF
jgi:hypothetical protein